MAALRRTALLIFSVAWLLSGCTGDAADDDAESSEEAILAGRREHAYGAVGLVKQNGSIGTGVLVARDLVLTAAHVANGAVSFHYGRVAPNVEPNEANLRDVRVVSKIVHPCFLRSAGEECPGPQREPIDIAVLRLAEPVTDVEPMKIVDQPLESFFGLWSPFEGDRCKAVGFGAHLLPDGRRILSVRRSATVEIEAVNVTEIVTVRGTGIATGGDSGGPLVCDGEIVGVVRGSAVPVPRGSVIRTKEAYERLDLHRAWLAAVLRRAR